MSGRAPFDPRERLEVLRHEPAAGDASPWTGRRAAMSVSIDGELRIDHGLVIDGADPLVALRECPCCGLFECELVEGYAASVRRLGPYVLWLTSWGELRCFGLEGYRAAFGGNPAALEPPRAGDDLFLDEPARAGAWRCPDGRGLAFDRDRGPEQPLARLSAWRPGAPLEVEAVDPPPDALELPALAGAGRSVWISRGEGRRAAWLPDAFLFPVWLAGPAVDEVVSAALGG